MLPGGLHPSSCLLMDSGAAWVKSREQSCVHSFQEGAEVFHLVSPPGLIYDEEQAENFLKGGGRGSSC